MTKNTKIWTGVIVVIGLVLVGWGILNIKALRAPITKNPIKIGFIGPLSGGPALWGEGARNMVQLATSEINENGGINGRDLQVEYEDGKCSSGEAVSAFEKLRRDGVKFILGGHCSPETAGIVPLTKDGQAFILASVTSADEVVTDSDYAYRTSPPTRDFTDKLAAIAIKKYQRVATLTEQAAFAKSYTKDFVLSFEKVGGKIVSEEGYQPKQTDFRTELLKVINLAPDALFISPQNPTTAINIIKQMKELNLQIPVFANSIGITPKVFSESNNPAALVGSFSIIPYTDKSTKDAQELSKKYQETFGSEVPYNYFYVSAVYDATHMLAQALEQCGVDDTSCVRDEFHNMRFKGVSLDYTFKDSGDSNFDSWAQITLDNKGETVVEPL